MLMREVMRSELMRVRALIIVGVCIVTTIWLVHVFDPEIARRVWRNVNPGYIYVILFCFIIFELWVYTAISRHLKLDRDLPVYRRYIGALIETSMPTLALALHIESMGPVQALGFVMPLVYFIFIILSTLRLDFWLSTFTGFVAAAELFAMAMHYRPLVNPDPEPEVYYHLSRSLVIFTCGVLAGAVGVQLKRGFAASIRAATARDRITNLFGQHVSPQVVERLMAEGTTAGSEVRRVAVMFVDRRSGRRQYRLAPAQGIHRDRRHRELCLAARIAQQGFQFAAVGIGRRPRRARRSRRRCETARRGRNPGV